jgi:hypothetical protein
MLSALAAAGTAGVRTASAVTANRVALARSRWAAEGCLAVALSRYDSSARAGRALSPEGVDTLYYTNGAMCWATAMDPAARPQGDTGKVNLNAAAPEVLSTLPGFTVEAVRAVLDARRWGERFSDLFQIMARLSPPAREAMLQRYRDLVGRVIFAPASIVVTATGAVTASPVKATIEALVVPAGPRVGVVRRRMW